MITNLPANQHMFAGVRKQRESNGTFDCIGMNTISYNRHKRENQLVAFNSFNTSNSLSYLHRYDRHWTKTNFPPPPPTRFSNKIVLIVDCCNLKILHMNDRAARTLFDQEKFPEGFEAKLNQVVASPYSSWVYDSASACQNAVGAVIIATSDLIDIIDCSGDSLTVSAFVQKLTRPMSERCLSLFAFERCHRFMTNCLLNSDGLIIDYDPNMIALFGKSVRNVNIASLVCKISVDDLMQLKPGSNMYVTGKNARNNAFPMTIVKQVSDGKQAEQTMAVELQVYTSISGLIIIDQCGNVLDCNSTFLRLFLGHEDTKANVINRNIRTLIPKYYEMVSCNRTGTCEYSTLDGLSSSVSSDINDSISAARLTNSLAKEMLNSPSLNSPPMKRRRRPSQSGCNGADYQHSPAKASSLAREVLLREAARSSNNYTTQSKITSTPTRSETDYVLPGNGHYHCSCLHFDGSLLDAECLVSQIENERWALWICRSCQDPHTIELYLDSVPNDICMDGSRLQYGNPILDNDTSYFSHYDNFVELQYGRLGPIFVSKKKNKSNDDRFITKFFSKSELKPFDYCVNKDGSLELREYHILSILDHVNIAKCIDIFEDSHFFQLILKRHGMDVVNFIALNPDMDEQLCSYMFKQLTDAIFYLHSNNVVHRNVRAENVLIDKKFNIKLIDFSYAHKDEFDDLPFVGSLDYCPPEVLHGLRYQGKPGDIWSLGVTLFMLMFGFLPFKEPYAIIRSIRLLPNLTSEQMSDLFSDLFCPLPQTRITCEQLQGHGWVNQEVNITLYKWEDVVKRGDVQTHIDYQAFQCNPPTGTDSNSDDQSVKAYTGCSPVVDRRRRESYSINSILNKTIDEGDLDADFNIIEKTDENHVERSISSFMRSLSDNLKKVKSFDNVDEDDDPYEDNHDENAVDCIQNDDLSFSSFDDTIKHEDECMDNHEKKKNDQN